jgi:hypothetical protein
LYLWRLVGWELESHKYVRNRLFGIFIGLFCDIA